MQNKTVLTGITPSGIAHLGNYFGSIKPSIELAIQNKIYFLIADYHSILKIWNGELRKEYVYKLAATLIALGLNPDKNILYKQSAIPETMELYWILSAITSKGILERSHAYKNYKDNIKNKININMGVFSYPVLMAADILIIEPDIIQVGADQIQHLEITKSLSKKLNFICKTKLFKKFPNIIKSNNIVTGIDGRKMSKSYDNVIPIFEEQSLIKNRIMKIITNSKNKNESKNINTCIIFNLYKKFVEHEEILYMKNRYNEGISWMEAKNILFEKINDNFTKMYNNYKKILSDKKYIDEILAIGATKVNKKAKVLLKKIKFNIGLL